eukprot:COSAG02_NODE_42205_length_386_cov_1.547038_2_plen_40_part_01
MDEGATPRPLEAAVSSEWSRVAAAPRWGVKRERLRHVRVR